MLVNLKKLYLFNLFLLRRKLFSQKLFVGCAAPERRASKQKKEKLNWQLLTSRFNVGLNFEFDRVNFLPLLRMRLSESGKLKLAQRHIFIILFKFMPRTN